MPSRKAQLVSPLSGDYIPIAGLSVTGVITAIGGISGPVTGAAQSITDGANLDLGTVTATTFVGDSIGTYRAAGLTNTGAGTSNLNVGVVTATSISGVVTGNITGTASSIISGSDLTVGVATAVTWLGDGSGITGAGSSAFIGQSVSAGTGTTTIDLSSGNIINFTQTVKTTTVSFANTGTANRVTIIRNPNAENIDWNISYSTGGVEFDGTDYLSIPDDSDFTFGTDDFTIEFWYKTNNISGLANGYDYIFSSGWPVQLAHHESGGSKIGFWMRDSATGDSGSYFISDLNTGGGSIASTSVWYHIAVTRSGSTFRIFLDGVLKNTQTSSSSAPAPGEAAQIGRFAGGMDSMYANGTLSNFRYIKGTALYTQDFVPPSAALTNVTNTKLLCCQSDSSTTTAAVIPTGSITAGGDPTAAAETVASSGTTVILPQNIEWPSSIKWNDDSTPTLISNVRTSAFQVFNLTTADAGVTWYGWESFEDDPQTFTLWSWGYNYRGQLGQDNVTPLSSPKQVPGTNWLMTNNGCSYVANNVSIATKSDGTIWSWGYGSQGMLGLNQSTPSAKISSPTQIGSNTNWGVGSSSRSVLWSKTDGTLWAWGYNTGGQLGLNESGPGTPKKSSPTQVGTDTNWSTSHSTGGKYASDQNSPSGRTGAIKTDGSLWMMGNGDLGQNNTTRYSSPVQIPGSWKSISLSGGGSIALKTDGTAWAWGTNSNAMLGQNNRTTYSSPIQIPGSWASITSGRQNSSGVKTDGTLWSWGYNNYGQLGLGDKTSYSSPVQVGANDTWSTNAFAAGAMGYLYNTTYLKTNGTLWTWGRNDKGQLGQSLPVNSHRSSPVQIPGTNWGGVTKSGETVVAHQFTA